MRLRLTDHSVTDLLAAFRSAEPTPGGGSASALAGAVGASLLAMVAGLPKPAAETAEDLAKLSAAGERCTDLALHLTSLVNRDSDAYDLVVQAFRMPKDTGDEKATRSRQIQAAMQEATDTPLDVMSACTAAIEQAAVVAAFGNRHASSDVQVGVELLGAGVRGAKLNIAVNLESLKNPKYAARARSEAERLVGEAEAGASAARARLTSS